MARLRFQDVCKTYTRDVFAVRDVRFEIADKEFIVLVGPSGCGKTSLLRMIAGLEEISSGEIFIDDVCINAVQPRDRDIAMVFQSYALFPHMTVFQNISFGLESRKVPKDIIRRKVEHAAELLEITELLQRSPKTLSGGERQRVALGRAIVREPKVFLLDEPLSNLDAKLRTQMRAEISALYKRLETTFIYVTHDQAEAMAMADRIAVMKDGSVEQIDTPQEIYNNPETVFVASFIGSPPMNLMNAEVIRADNRNGIRLGAYVLPFDLIPDRYRNQDNLLFGVRPEHLTISRRKERADGEECFAADVLNIENLGAESLVYLTLSDGQRLIATSPEQTDCVIGEEVQVTFDIRKIKLFDPTSGRVVKTCL